VLIAGNITVSIKNRNISTTNGSTPEMTSIATIDAALGGRDPLMMAGVCGTVSVGDAFPLQNDRRRG
jgi:hypothetical protein